MCGQAGVEGRQQLPQSFMVANPASGNSQPQEISLEREIDMESWLYEDKVGTKAGISTDAKKSRI